MAANSDDRLMLTVVFKHDQAKPLAVIHEELVANGFFERFPPEGVEVVGWTVAMGLGQVVTLRFPASRLREVNRAIEGSAWGAFRTEIYATYDFRPIAAERRGGKLTLAKD
ncbi:MAG: hypothetical protein KGI57_02890 [Hyphomicrobiales bacterium]|nr:hypothetical protein [Hyphomicrobiales bacterium]MDE2016633.1 hypothetical protein [Hyphomicrobiales bacterium]